MKRYTIQFPDGGFSKGPQWWRPLESVPLEKAKLWRTKGHVVQHLSHREYPPGCKVVEVEIATTVTPLFDVGAHVEERSAKREEQAKRDHVRAAEERLRTAEAELEAARALVAAYKK
jgi:hypothetical protein